MKYTKIETPEFVNDLLQIISAKKLYRAGFKDEKNESQFSRKLSAKYGDKLNLEKDKPALEKAKNTFLIVFQDFINKHGDVEPIPENAVKECIKMIHEIKTEDNEVFSEDESAIIDKAFNFLF